MLFQPQLLISQPLEHGYVNYLKLNAIANTVMAGLYQVFRTHIGLRLMHNSEKRTVIGLYFLGQSHSDKQLARALQMELTSESPDEFTLFLRVLNHGFHYDFFLRSANEAEDCYNLRISKQLVDLIGHHLNQLNKMTPEEIDLAVPAIESPENGPFMKVVKNIVDLGPIDSIYEIEFEDGLRGRFSMHSRVGSNIYKGDWLLHSTCGKVEHIPASQVN